MNDNDKKAAAFLESIGVEACAVLEAHLEPGRITIKRVAYQEDVEAGTEIDKSNGFWTVTEVIE